MSLTYVDMSQFAEDGRIYLRPTCFVDRPHGLDERCLRLAGGLLWFSAWEIIVRDSNADTGAGSASAVATGNAPRKALVAVDALDDWIAALPDNLAAQVQGYREEAIRPRPPLTIGEHRIAFDQPNAMGILNYTPDSFSDGGRFADVEEAIAAGFDMASAGAALIDVGGESTRPDAKLVWEEDEITRTIPIVSALAQGGVAVSIDTRKAAVMQSALAEGAAMVNDISALRYDERAMDIVAASNCAVVLMHAPSATSNPHANAEYSDVLLDVFDMLEQRIAACTEAGIDKARLIIDVGIGFGKNVHENLALTNGLALFHTLGCPLLYGASRKRLIGALDSESASDARLGGSVALHYQAATLGAQLLRVHDVAETRQALRVWRGLRDTALVG